MREALPAVGGCMTALIDAVMWYWLTCDVEVVRANWIPSQVAVLLAVREAVVQAAA